MKLYTASIRDTKALNGAGIVPYDTTVKSGKGLFRPTWDIVMGIKNGDITEEEYTRYYKALLRQSYLLNHDEWKTFLSQEVVAVQCYCAKGKFCHRRILAEVLEKVAKHLGLAFEYCGEYNDS